MTTEPMSTEPMSTEKGLTMTVAPTTESPSAEPRRADRARARVAGQALERFGLIGLWVVMAGVFAVLEPDLMLRSSTFQTIFNSQATLLFLAMALLCTLVVGEFVDLSVPCNLGLSATLFSVLVVDHGWGRGQRPPRPSSPRSRSGASTRCSSSGSGSTPSSSPSG